jgi:hypothetical protein
MDRTPQVWCTTHFKTRRCSQPWWHMPIIIAFGRLRQGTRSLSPARDTHETLSPKNEEKKKQRPGVPFSQNSERIQVNQKQN